MNQKRRAAIEACEISELKTYSLGGFSQKVLIEGRHRTAPIVIFLHGGPGFPIPFCEGCRGMFPEITNRFILVYWDQLGCGKNKFKIDESFTVNRFVDMTVDLIREVRKEFPENHISLFGVSWGSILAAKAAERVPELLHKVLIYGQVLKQLTFNEEVYTVLLSSNMPIKLQQKIATIRNAEQHSLKELRFVIRLMQRYTEGYQAKAGGKMPIGEFVLGILTSPDYSLRDFMAVFMNSFMRNKSLLLELIEIDLSDVLREIKVPYLILQGDTDIVTSTKMIAAFMNTIKNDNVILRHIKNSGHMPGQLAMDYIIREGFNFLEEA